MTELEDLYEPWTTASDELFESINSFDMPMLRSAERLLDHVQQLTSRQDPGNELVEKLLAVVRARIPLQEKLEEPFDYDAYYKEHEGVQD